MQAEEGLLHEILELAVDLGTEEAMDESEVALEELFARGPRARRPRAQQLEVGCATVHTWPSAHDWYHGSLRGAIGTLVRSSAIAAPSVAPEVQGLRRGIESFAPAFQ